MAVGRPRAFCTEEALDKALAVFWEKGYEGASLQDLTEAMGINRPSLYAAFGNKESLFLKAMERYAERNACLMELMNEPTARLVVEKLLYGTADMLTEPDTPHSCLTVSAALACSEETAPIKNALAAKRKQMQLLLQQRLERAQKERDLPENANPSALALYICTVIYGMSIQASSGATRAQLQKVAALTLAAWP